MTFDGALGVVAQTELARALLLARPSAETAVFPVGTKVGALAQATDFPESAPNSAAAAVQKIQFQVDAEIHAESKPKCTSDYAARRGGCSCSCYEGDKEEKGDKACFGRHGAHEERERRPLKLFEAR